MNCPNCDGELRPINKTADGYPIEECDKCNTFALLPVGEEPPLRRILRALHEVGCEPGSVTPTRRE